MRMIATMKMGQVDGVEGVRHGGEARAGKYAERQRIVECVCVTCRQRLEPTPQPAAQMVTQFMQVRVLMVLMNDVIFY